MRVGASAESKPALALTRRGQQHLRTQTLEVFTTSATSPSCGIEEPYAQENPLFCSGSVLTRLPVAAKMALQIAGKIGGSVGSPNPVGE